MTVSSKKGERAPAAPAGPVPITLDPVTAAELHRFNQYLELQEERDRRERALKKAEADKDQAAAAVRDLERDSTASKETKAQAEQAYKDAVANLAAVKEGKVPDGEARAAADDDDDAGTEPSETEPAEAEPAAESGA
ncbi:MAG: hypothetical protein HYX32_07825 [Actinobacteria bacterium]|nr:hypothetical protein [Actinomycetota bacterium]